MEQANMLDPVARLRAALLQHLGAQKVAELDPLIAGAAHVMDEQGRAPANRAREATPPFDGSVKLVIKPCQAKKTAEVIDMMVEDLARDDILHVFISDNFCAQSQQVYGRIKTALHEALRKQPIVIDWHSGGSGKPTEKCMWTKDMIVMTVLTGNCRHITTLANKTRLQGLQTVLKDVLKEGIEVDGKKKKMKVKIYIDEADTTSSEVLQHLRTLVNKYPARVQLVLITATPLQLFSYLENKHKKLVNGGLVVHKYTRPFKDEYTFLGNLTWYMQDTSKASTATMEEKLEQIVYGGWEAGEEPIFSSASGSGRGTRLVNDVLIKILSRKGVEVNSKTMKRPKLKEKYCEAMGLEEFPEPDYIDVLSPSNIKQISKILVDTDALFARVLQEAEQNAELAVGPESYIFLPAASFISSHYALAAYVSSKPELKLAVLVINGDGYTFYPHGHKFEGKKPETQQKAGFLSSRNINAAADGLAGDDSGTEDDEEVGEEEEEEEDEDAEEEEEEDEAGPSDDEMLEDEEEASSDGEASDDDHMPGENEVDGQRAEDPMVQVLRHFKKMAAEKGWGLAVTGYNCVGRAITMQSSGTDKEAPLRFSHLMFVTPQGSKFLSAERRLADLYQLAGRGASTVGGSPAAFSCDTELRNISVAMENTATYVFDHKQGERITRFAYEQLLEQFKGDAAAAAAPPAAAAAPPAAAAPAPAAAAAAAVPADVAELCAKFDAMKVAELKEWLAAHAPKVKVSRVVRSDLVAACKAAAAAQ